MDTADVIEAFGPGPGSKKRPGHADPASFVSTDRSGRLLLAKIVHELDQLDSTIPVLGGRRVEPFLLTVGQAVERGLVLGRRFGERLGNCRLQIGREIRIIGVGSVY